MLVCCLSSNGAGEGWKGISEQSIGQDAGTRGCISESDQWALGSSCAGTWGHSCCSSGVHKRLWAFLSKLQDRLRSE